MYLPLVTGSLPWETSTRCKRELCLKRLNRICRTEQPYLQVQVIINIKSMVKRLSYPKMKLICHRKRKSHYLLEKARLLERIWLSTNDRKR